MNFKLFGFIFIHFILIVSISLLLFVPELVDKSFQRFSLVICFVSIFIFLLIKNRENNNYLSFNNIFIVGYVIVFFQVVVLQHFGYYLPSWSYNKYWSSPYIENISVIVSVVAVLCYIIGNLYGSFKRRTERKKKLSNEIYSISLLVIIAYVSYFAFFSTSGSYRSGVYFASDALGISSYFLKIFNASLSAAIIIKLTQIANDKNNNIISIKDYISIFGYPLLILFFWNLAFNLYVGDRGVIISYGLLFISVYVYRIKKFNLIQVLAMIFSASVVLTVIGQVRQSNDDTLTYIQQFNSIIEGNNNKSRWYEEKVPGDSFIELAHSGRTLNHSIDNVPETYDYRYGVYAFKRIVGVVPGLQGIVNKLIDGDDSKYFSTSEFISYLIQGEHRLYGDGSSITADLYLDFGFTGVFIGMFLFGLFIGSSENKAYSGYVSYLSISWVGFLIYYSKSLYLSRSSIFLELSSMFLIWVMLYFNSKISIYIRNRL